MVKAKPIGDIKETFIQWLDTFCNNPFLCSLMPATWMNVPKAYKEDCWKEIKVVLKYNISNYHLQPLS